MGFAKSIRNNFCGQTQDALTRLAGTIECNEATLLTITAKLSVVNHILYLDFLDVNSQPSKVRGFDTHSDVLLIKQIALYEQTELARPPEVRLGKSRRSSRAESLCLD